jgi:hypothetical protein
MSELIITIMLGAFLFLFLLNAFLSLTENVIDRIKGSAS